MDITIKFCVAFCVGLFGGIAADQWLHTAPWGVLIGILVGFGLSGGVIIQCIIQEKKRLAEADPIVIKPHHGKKAPLSTHAMGGGTLLSIDDLHQETHPADTDPDLVDTWLDNDDD